METGKSKREPLSLYEVLSLLNIETTRRERLRLGVYIAEKYRTKTGKEPVKVWKDELVRDRLMNYSVAVYAPDDWGWMVSSVFVNLANLRKWKHPYFKSLIDSDLCRAMPRAKLFSHYANEARKRIKPRRKRITKIRSNVKP